LDYGYMDQVVQDCAGILLANETVVQDAADGKHGAMGYLRGQYMKFTKGKGNITRATELFNRVFEEHT
jgi:Asp-tRNA(Asn)/Glu-tRNA(Gln) amidotransferase B subunit